MSELISDNPLLVVIAGGEIGFWLVLAAALAARYLLGNRPLSGLLLLTLPLIDVIILIITAHDLRAGGAAGFSHGLAAVYLGVTIAFGHRIMRWADLWVAHRFAGGPPPPKPPKSGLERVRYEWREWGRFVLAWAITGVVTLLLTALIGDPARAEPLWNWLVRMTAVGVIWLVGWPLWVTIRERGALVEARRHG